VVCGEPNGHPPGVSGSIRCDISGSDITHHTLVEQHLVILKPILFIQNLWSSKSIVCITNENIICTAYLHHLIIHRLFCCQ
jgi:hypothetical protein